MVKGWLKVPGIRPDGDRTLEEQMMGLDFALSEAKDKTVLDLGAAEGLIGREFAKAGAKLVLGIEALQTHLDVAHKACCDYPQMKFVCSDLALYIEQQSEPYPQYDIVLALGIIHKLRDPELPLRFAARSAKTLLVFRAPAKARHGVVRSKHGDGSVDVPAVMKAEGFVEEHCIAGAYGESAQYWRRV